MSRSRNPQALIANLMNEDFDMSQSGDGMSAQTTMPPPDEHSSDEFSEPASDGTGSDFTEDDLRITKRFIELMGGVERAREIVDKVSECEDCLGIIDDGCSDGSCESDAAIEAISTMIPIHPDMPTGKAIEMSTLYNPGGVQSSYQ